MDDNHTNITKNINKNTVDLDLGGHKLLHMEGLSETKIRTTKGKKKKLEDLYRSKREEISICGLGKALCTNFSRRERESPTRIVNRGLFFCQISNLTKFPIPIIFS